jgi:uncharacterized protein YndB with AHSA1/START domain
MRKLRSKGDRRPCRTVHQRTGLGERLAQDCEAVYRAFPDREELARWTRAGLKWSTLRVLASPRLREERSELLELFEQGGLTDGELRDRAEDLLHSRMKRADADRESPSSFADRAPVHRMTTIIRQAYGTTVKMQKLLAESGSAGGLQGFSAPRAAMVSAVDRLARICCRVLQEAGQPACADGGLPLVIAEKAIALLSEPAYSAAGCGSPQETDGD